MVSLTAYKNRVFILASRSNSRQFRKGKEQVSRWGDARDGEEGRAGGGESG